MDKELSKLSMSSQWPEGRSFERLYGRNPYAQASYVANLLGHKAQLIELRLPSDGEQEVVDAIDTVVRSFAATYPEFLEEITHPGSGQFSSDVYVADPDLLSTVNEILNGEQR